jgi:hypothetical protein
MPVGEKSTKGFPKPGISISRKLWRPVVLSTGVVLLICLILGCADVISGLSAYRENRAVHEAARQYLDAEVRRDYKSIYACLAPSSLYCASNTYEMYLAEAKNAPAITSYKIVKISHIQANEDRQRYPKIEKFAQVEVELVLVFSDVGKKTEVNFAFPFIKEGGKWYKG